MRRRLFLAAASLTAAPARAQAPPPRVGFLVAGDPEPTWRLFRKAMAGLGLIEGKSVAYEFRAGDSTERLEAAARELVALKVSVIVAVLSPATAAAVKTTSTIPIVFNGGAPVTGLVTNMARPEGNLTGAFSPSSTVAAKGLQLFREMRPQTRTVGLLLNAADPFHVPLLRDVEATSRAEKIELVPVFLKPEDQPVEAFTTLASRRVDGVLVQPSLGMTAMAARALEARLPAFSFRREFAEVGGLFSYGADQAEINRAVASQVERILKGAKPSDLPVQQATKFELVINRKTAAALGLTLPPLFVASADEVID
ncbi:MAG: ABC transporter substrate-binding protein [Reyranella sp.]|nr:ABC transporter substrate-binding protein [Reyranella sp.]MBL6651230.1 ABC transporter substrate-binding protein [Reyranella sp.]